MCRVIALDHHCGDVYLMTLVDPGDAVSTSSAKAWRRSQEACIMDILQQPKQGNVSAQPARQGGSASLSASATAEQASQCTNGHSRKPPKEGLEERQHSNGHAEVITHLQYWHKMLAFLYHYAAVRLRCLLYCATEQEPEEPNLWAAGSARSD